MTLEASKVTIAAAEGLELTPGATPDTFANNSLVPTTAWVRSLIPTYNYATNASLIATNNNLNIANSKLTYSRQRCMIPQVIESSNYSIPAQSGIEYAYWYNIMITGTVTLNISNAYDDNLYKVTSYRSCMLILNAGRSDAIWYNGSFILENNSFYYPNGANFHNLEFVKSGRYIFVTGY